MSAGPFTVYNCEQRSPEWLQIRLGRLTGSRAVDMLATIKTGEAAARRNLRTQLVLERVTGKLMEGFGGYQNQAIQQGVDREPEAREAYERLTGLQVHSTGFLALDNLMAGCSLDGHVGDYEGIIEIKSPVPATHLEYLRSGRIPYAYQKQVLHNMWICGARWADWFSYNPDFPPSLAMKLVHWEPEPWELEEYEMQARSFLIDVDMEERMVRELAQ